MKTECNDGIDNDNDGCIDLKDKDCKDISDNSEYGSICNPCAIAGGECVDSCGEFQYHLENYDYACDNIEIPPEPSSMVTNLPPIVYAHYSEHALYSQSYYDPSVAPPPEDLACVKEGGRGIKSRGYECCEGLSAISLSEPDSFGGCIGTYPDDFFVCAKCGNAICGSGENICNCPTDCKGSEPDCVEEGEKGNGFSSDVCCEGLTKIANSWPIGDTCLAATDGSFVCSYCGDGVCGEGENKCNCGIDCLEKEFICCRDVECISMGGVCKDKNVDSCEDGYYSASSPYGCPDGLCCLLTECNDGIDNDGDGCIDLKDEDCEDENDNTESGSICGACVRNGGACRETCEPTEYNEGAYDYSCQYAGANQPQLSPGDVCCMLAECSDGKDNDGNGCADYPTDLGCESVGDNDESGGKCNFTETSECSDGKDNDGNGCADYPTDSGCESATDNSEVNGTCPSPPTPPPSSCFPEGTKILMGDNSYKDIEEVKIGDYVMAYDEKNKINVPVEVLELEQPIRDHMCEIVFNDKSSLLLTNEHPIYTTKGWKSIDPSETYKENNELEVKRLVKRDKVMFCNSKYKKIISVNCWKEKIKTYNLKSVDKFNNYYAGDVLVHNKGRRCTEDWDCSEWTACRSDGTQLRTCIDSNNCGTTKNKPEETRTCIYAPPLEPEPECIPNWDCTDWTDCSDEGRRSRSCIDLNNCGEDMYTEVESCVPAPKELGKWILYWIIIPLIILAAIAAVIIVIIKRKEKRRAKKIKLKEKLRI
jgi:hypothetical protein